MKQLKIIRKATGGLAFLILFSGLILHVQAQSSHDTQSFKQDTKGGQKAAKYSHKHSLFHHYDYNKELEKEVDKQQTEASKNSLTYEKHHLEAIKAAGNDAGITPKYIRKMSEYDGAINRGDNPVNDELKNDHSAKANKHLLKQYKATGKDRRQHRKSLKHQKSSIKKSLAHQ